MNVTVEDIKEKIRSTQYRYFSPVRRHTVLTLRRK